MTKSIRMAWKGVVVAAPSSSCRRTMCTATSPSSASSHEQPALTSVLTSILRVMALSSTTSTCMWARGDLGATEGASSGGSVAVKVTVVGPVVGTVAGTATAVEAVVAVTVVGMVAMVATVSIGR